MRKVLGVLIGLAGFGLAIYVGLWLMFVGGIVQVIEAAQEDPVPASEVAWGVVRVIFASAATVFTIYFTGFIAVLVGGWSTERKSRW